jgi:hypothetical protein
MSVKLSTRSWVSNHVQYTEEIVPEGMVLVDEFHPCMSTCPWDYYGRKHQLELMAALSEQGIPSVALRTNELKLSPTGTGPGGAVRFGDAMLPGIYRIAVASRDHARAVVAIATHKQEVEDWLDGKCELPTACRD